jgi:VCBS repeat-containing protein
VNDPPVAVADTYSVAEDNVLAPIAAGGVLANDIDVENDPLTAQQVTAPTHGSLTLNANGSFTYMPAANFNGTDSFTYKANDGSADSNTVTVTITVTAVNDAPSFSKGANQTVAEDAAAQSVSGWATAISPGPSNESGQTVSFVITNNTNAGLFSADPAVSPTGTLTYTPAANQHGTATITLKITDNGGTANGGVDQSATQSFDITITAVNDAPTSSGRAYGANSLQANMQRSFDAASGLLVGAADAADVAGNPSWSPTFTVGSVNGVAPVSGTITTAIAGVGTVVANASTGAFTIDPAAGVIGNVSFNFTVCDNGEGTPASQCSATATASFDIAGPVIWFVNSAAATNGSGTLASPFNNLAAADAVDAANQGIFLYSSATSYTGALTLNSGEKLVGQGTTGTTFDTLFGINPPANTIARPTLGSGTSTLTGTVTLASGSTVTGVAISGASGAGIAGTNTGGSTINQVTISGANGGVALTGAAAGTFSFTNLAITTTGGTGFLVNSSASPTINVGSAGTESVSATGGTGVSISTINASSSIAFDSVSASGGVYGINLASTGGVGAAFGSGSLFGSTADFRVNGGSGTVSYSGTLADGTGLSADIQNRSGGSITLSGNITDGSDAGGGLNMALNTGGSTTFSGTTKTLNTGASGAFVSTGSGHTITFSNGGLGINATTGAGFTATGGGTVNVTGANNTLTTTTGTALNVANTTIGASGLTFQSISANGATNGIVLNNTGASGSLTVTGDGNTSVGGNNSGGVIQHTTSYGISLANTLSPSFTNVSIHDISRNGIDGTGVTNVTFKNGQVTNTGTAAAGQFEENGIAFVDRTTPNPVANTITGNVVMTGNLISGVHRNAITIETWGNGTISNLNISGNTFSGPSAAGALKDATLATTNAIADAIHVFSQGSASTASHITTGTVNNNTISGFEFFDGSIFVGGNGVRVAGGSGNGTNTTVTTLGAAGQPIEITGNDVDNVGSNAIAVSFNGQNGIGNFNIHDNGTALDPMSNMEGLGISVFFGGSGTFSALVNNNAVDNNGPTVNAGSAGIAVKADDGPAGLANTTGTSTISVNNNLVTNPDGFGIRGIVRSSNDTLNLKVQNNDVGTPSAANREAIRIDGGSTNGNTRLCLNMSGNTGPIAGGTDNLVGSGVDAGIGLRKQGTVTTTNFFGINGITANPTNAQVQAYVGTGGPTNNHSADGSGGSVDGVDIISGSGYMTCSLP